MPGPQNGLLLAACVYSSETSRLAARGVWHLGRLLIHSAMFSFSFVPFGAQPASLPDYPARTKFFDVNNIELLQLDNGMLHSYAG